jgi:hypothetical protein
LLGHEGQITTIYQSGGTFQVQVSVKATLARGCPYFSVVAEQAFPIAEIGIGNGQRALEPARGFGAENGATITK